MHPMNGVWSRTRFFMGAMAALASASTAGAATLPIVVIHQNIGGGQSPLAGDDKALNDINAAVAAYPNLTVVTMNEVCASQAEEFVRTHPGWSWAFATTKHKGAACTTGSNPNIQDDRLGEMIASPYPFNGVAKYCLMPDASGNRHADANCDPDLDPGLPDAQGLLCAYVQAPGLPAGSQNYKVCVTHLGTSDDPTRKQQTAWIRALVQPDLAAGRVVSVSGDFNSEPNMPSLNNMYRQKLTGDYTGNGDFVDGDATDPDYFAKAPAGVTCKAANQNRPAMCRSGQNTAHTHSGVDKKIDYIFFPIERLDFAAYGRWAIDMFRRPGNTSHHNLLVGGANLKFP